MIRERFGQADLRSEALRDLWEALPKQAATRAEFERAVRIWAHLNAPESTEETPAKVRDELAEIAPLAEGLRE